MKITESRLRRLIRQTIRESHEPKLASDEAIHSLHPPRAESDNSDLARWIRTIRELLNNVEEATVQASIYRAAERARGED